MLKNTSSLSGQKLYLFIVLLVSELFSASHSLKPCSTLECTSGKKRSP